MNVQSQFNAMNQSLETKVTTTSAELMAMEKSLQDFLTRRIVDTLYAELLPLMRDAIIKALSANELAKIVEGEISLAIKGALNNS